VTDAIDALILDLPDWIRRSTTSLSISLSVATGTLGPIAVTPCRGWPALCLWPGWQEAHELANDVTIH
jgi:hypothetical protein